MMAKGDYTNIDIKISGYQEVSMVAIASDIEKCEHIATILKAMGHPIRLQIVALLCERDTHVNALADQIGAPQSAVSQQLGILRMRGLVARRRESGLAVYSLAEPRLRTLVECMEGCKVGH